MFKIKKGDIVQAITGEDKGKKGKVLQIIINNSKAIVEGINLVKKHRRRTREDQQGGIVSVEAAVSLANLGLVCKNCNQPVKAGFTVLKDGTKSRICKRCKEVI